MFKSEALRFSALDRHHSIYAVLAIEVKTGQRTVFQYLTKPIVKTFSQSLGERCSARKATSGWLFLL